MDALLDSYEIVSNATLFGVDALFHDGVVELYKSLQGGAR